jgi:hypothetical protein
MGDIDSINSYVFCYGEGNMVFIPYIHNILENLNHIINKYYTTNNGIFPIEKINATVGSKKVER